MRLDGASCFSTASSYVRLEPRSTLSFQIDVLARFTGEATGRLVFMSRGDGIGTANASTLVFALKATIGIGAPLSTAAVDARLYATATVPVVVTNPFNESATFKLSLAETKPPLESPLAVAEADAGRPGLPRRAARGVAAAPAAAAALAGGADDDLSLIHI